MCLCVLCRRVESCAVGECVGVSYLVIEPHRVCFHPIHSGHQSTPSGTRGYTKPILPHRADQVRKHWYQVSLVLSADVYGLYEHSCNRLIFPEQLRETRPNRRGFLGLESGKWLVQLPVKPTGVAHMTPSVYGSTPTPTAGETQRKFELTSSSI